MKNRTQLVLLCLLLPLPLSYARPAGIAMRMATFKKQVLDFGERVWGTTRYSREEIQRVRALVASIGVTCIALCIWGYCHTKNKLPLGLPTTGSVKSTSASSTSSSGPASSDSTVPLSAPSSSSSSPENTTYFGYDEKNAPWTFALCGFLGIRPD